MSMHKCSTLGWICFILVIIGGINWGLIGFFSFNLVATIVGAWPAVERIVYILVGLSSLYLIYEGFRCCRACKSSCDTDDDTKPQF